MEPHAAPLRAAPMPPFARSSSGRSALGRAASLAALALVTLGASACGGGGGDAAGATDSWASVRSMAGDTVVMRSAGGLPDAGTHRMEERWRIGDVDGLDSTVTFGRISGFAVRDDSVAAVFDEALTTLRLYDGGGAYMATLGRKGAGPGEYSRANGLAFLPDGRLALWDLPTSRITIYRTDTTDTDAWRPPVTGMFTSNALMSVRGWALAVFAPLRDTAESDDGIVRRSRGAVFLYESDGLIADTIVFPPSATEPQLAVASNASVSTAYGLPYATTSVNRLLADGRLARGTTNAYRIDLAGADAPLRVEVAAEPVPVPPEEARERRAYVEWVMTNVDPKWTWTMDDIPSVKPFFQSIFAAADGRMWVSVSTPSERIPEEEREPPRAADPSGRPSAPAITWRAPTWYDVFERDGTLFGRVVMPPRATLLAARGDLAWGTITDEFDVPYLVQWRLTPAAGTSAGAGGSQ